MVNDAKWFESELIASPVLQRLRAVGFTSPEPFAERHHLLEDRRLFGVPTD